MNNSFKFFRNTDCKYFPCHDVIDPEEFNCMFCFCPLYCLEEECGGDFRYNAKGIKDCSKCLLPHRADSYTYIIKYSSRKNIK